MNERSAFYYNIKQTISSTFLLLHFLYALYKLIDNETEKNIRVLKTCATRCGSLAIKLLQFLSMNYIIKTPEMKEFFEKCVIHSIEDTKKMYLVDFGRPIEDTFILHEVIGSGSIGQVYRAFDKKKGVYVALKVKHPGINKMVHCFIGIIRSVLYVMKYFNSYSYIILEYTHTIALQLDYTLETENTKKLKKHFENEECVVVPEIYTYSKNFISMSYHEGIPFDSITDKTLQLKASIYLNFLTMSSLLLYDLFHGDLHYGNWKIDTFSEKGVLKIIVYDCGLMYSTGDLAFNRKFVEYVSKNNYYGLLYDVNPHVNKKKLKKIIENIQQRVLNVTTSKRMRIFITESIKHKLITDKNVINLLNGYAIVGEILLVFIEKINKFVYRKDDIAILFYTYQEMLNKLGVFKELNTFLKNWMDSDPRNKEQFTQWLLQEFGHSDSHIIGSILYKKLI
jgi:predicted unusual protein kinase regulating ubiquinone biosynthesis (AarF/ABC1/UbiB family)